MNLGEIREQIHSRKIYSHLPLSSPGGKNLGQATREKQVTSTAPPLAPQPKTGAPVGQQELLLPKTIFGMPTSTAIKLALSLSLTASVIGLVVKLRDLFRGGKR